MVIPVDLGTWLKEQAWVIALIFGCVALVFLILKFSAKRRHEALAKEREGVTESSFAAHLEQFGFDPVIAASTFRYLQEVQLVQFPILPSDLLDEDLGLDSEDIHQTIREMLAALGREFNPGLLHKPLNTVEDLVRLLQASPRLSATAAA